MLRASMLKGYIMEEQVIIEQKEEQQVKVETTPVVDTNVIDTAIKPVDTPTIKAEMLEQTIATITENYNRRLEEQKKAYEQEIVERNKVITQLLNGNDNTATKPLSISDKINAKRNYKKW